MRPTRTPTRPTAACSRCSMPRSAGLVAAVTTAPRRPGACKRTHALAHAQSPADAQRRARTRHAHTNEDARAHGQVPQNAIFFLAYDTLRRLLRVDIV